uniref:Ras-specific guanine nucleotide-releasing factor 2 n=1 Tax=Cacopsylla melanoneura TaxID=428564 RepID=A0A8D8QKI8_9HEMI
MLSPKLQRIVRINDHQLTNLSDRAKYDHSLSGYLEKRTSDQARWQSRWFILYQNLLFYYETEGSNKPSGVIFLEGCYCDRVIPDKASRKDKDIVERQHCIGIHYRRENQRQYELRASSEQDCKQWIENIREASFNKLLLQKEELEQKHLHLLQIVESEKTAKWRYTQQCEELATEIKKLRTELFQLKREWRPTASAKAKTPGGGNGFMSDPGGSISSGQGGLFSTTNSTDETTSAAEAEETAELKKIKKVQSFFRGWLCRRRWKQIVEQYIKSPHAESMRKRNSIVFRMVEAEEEYMEQMQVLVSCFLRPFKMAASSKRPPCSHEDVNSIFLNSETVLFLHQIFLKGLTSRMESWPTLVLGDLFDMLLPMLGIYQEYVRNHHYSLQVLTECKQQPEFVHLLKRLEMKPACQGRSLEMFLTFPMHQIPRYIVTLHELLAHTPHDHVERKSLQNARQQLEDLSRQMHDEVSETENLRKNLAVERLIVEGCDILLDVNQVFVRQGTLIQFPTDKPKAQRIRLSHFKSEKEIQRQCFLFSNHLIICTRGSSGRLHLVPDIGKIPLADATLIEDPLEHVHGDTTGDTDSVCSLQSHQSALSENVSFQNRDFKMIVAVKATTSSQNNQNVPPLTIHLIAPTIQEKAAWVSDITQCMDSVHYNNLLRSTLTETASITMLSAIRHDPNLFRDDVDIKYLHHRNPQRVGGGGYCYESQTIPHIVYATKEKLLENLTDLRFVSIDFLNTFLLTYRAFTNGVTVLEALRKAFYNAEPPDSDQDQEDDFYTSTKPGKHRQHYHVSGGHQGGEFESNMSLDDISLNHGPSGDTLPIYNHAERRWSGANTSRKFSGASSGYASEIMGDGHRESIDSTGHFPRRTRSRKHEEDKGLGLIKESSGSSGSGSIQTGTQSPSGTPQHRKISIRVDKPVESGNNGMKEEANSLSVPRNNNIAGSSSNDTLTGSNSEITVLSGPSSPGNISNRTLVGQDPIEGTFDDSKPCAKTFPPGHTTSSVQQPVDTSPLTATPSHPLTQSSSPQSTHPQQSSPQGSRPSTSSESSTPQSVKNFSTTGPNAGSPQSPKPCLVTTAGVPQSPKLVSVQSSAGNMTNGPLPSPKTAARPTNFSEEKFGGPKSPKLIPRPPTTGPIPHIQTTAFPLDKGSQPPPPPPRILKESLPSTGPYHAARQHRHSHQEETMPQLKEPAFAQSSNWLGPERQNRSASMSHIFLMHRGSDANVQHFPIRKRSVADDDPYLSEDNDCWNLSAHSSRSASIATTNALYAGRRSIGCCEGENVARQATPRASFQQDSPQHSSKAGVVITSSRKSQRRSSTSTAATAFAIATSASSNPRDISPVEEVRNKRKESILSTATTMRVLNVLRHWISKHTQDFIQDKELRYMTLEFLEEIVCTPNLLPAEYKAATQLTRMLTQEECSKHDTNLQDLLAPPHVVNKENIETLSALEIAEQMTYIDYHIFKSIRSEEFLGQAWLKSEKLTKAPHIVLFTQRFNTMSKLVANEILNRSNLTHRVHVIEKWIAVADILKCLNNFNGVLTIVSAMNNSSVFRLKKTWDKVSKTTKQTYDKLRQVVDAEEKFHNLKSKLQHCDPPCIPYLGMYLTELATLDEVYPTFTKEGETNLVYFTKIRRMANTIRDITQYQNTPYKIEYNPKVANYILDTSWIIEDEDILHQKSMEIEPRTTGRPSCSQLPNLPLNR